MSKTTLTKALVAAGLCGVASLALAGGPDMPMAHHEMYHGGVFLGGQVGTNNEVNTLIGTEVGTVVGYNNDYMTVSLNGGISHFETAGSKNTLFFLGGELGYRQRIMMTNLFWKAGVGGSYDFNSTSNSNDPWSVGGYAGLDYQPIRHLQASVSIYPVNYTDSGTSNTNAWNFFNTGNISLAYVF